MECKHYHERIVELHLRRSKSGYWTELFVMDRDLDYHRPSEHCVAWNHRPHLIPEQAGQAQSPDTMKAAHAHSKESG